MKVADLIDQYLEGPQLLSAVVNSMTADQVDSTPIPEKWSTRQVVCHIADFEPVYAVRMKHVLAEDQPAFTGGFHQQFADNLAYDQRDICEELQVIAFTRSQMARILRSKNPDVFERTGFHAIDGPMTLLTLLERITNHIPHHLRFIEEKKQAMAG